jgi:hypothetical protein
MEEIKHSSCMQHDTANEMAEQTVYLSPWTLRANVALESSYWQSAEVQM